MNQIDTVVVPAREDGFTQVFLGENMWRSIRIHFSMLTKIRHIALYQVAPVSAITYVAEVARIELWKDTQKYALFFKGPAHKITPIPFVPHGRVNALQNIRYTSLARITQAKNLDDLF